MQPSKTANTFNKAAKKTKINTRSKSSPDRVTTIPIVNQKKIPLHFLPYHSSDLHKNINLEEHKKPQFWGCLLSPAFHIMNEKKISRLSKSLDKNRKDDRSWSSERQKSEIILTKYLVRKQKKMQKSPFHYSKCYGTIQLQQRKNSQEKFPRSPAPYLTQISHKYETSTFSNKWNRLTNLTTTNISNEEEEFKSQKDIKREEQMNKIGELNKIIKWRSRLASSLQEELERIKNDQMWKF